MQLPPIQVYLTWPQANYTNPSEVRGPAVLILTLIFVPLLVILVALRAYTRVRLTRSFGPDDIAIVAAVVPTICCAVLTLCAVRRYGWDRHVWDVPTDEFVVALKFALAVEILFSFACSFTRLSILLLTFRIMTVRGGVLRRLVIAMIVLICVEEFIFCIVAINTCRPVSDYWTLSFAPQNCINEAAHILTAGVINTFNDFCVVLIPIPVVLKLRLPLRQRIFCALLFGAGFIVCIAGGVRIAYMYQLNIGYDKTWLACPAWICATIELYIGIIVTSIPTIKPFVVRHFPSILGSNGFTKHGQSLNRHVTNLESYVEGTSSESPVSEEDLDVVKIPAVENNPAEKNISQEKSRTLALPPVVSAFSTYSIREEPTHRAAEWGSSHPPIGEPHSSNTSISSFNITWISEQDSRLVAPGHAGIDESGAGPTGRNQGNE